MDFISYGRQSINQQDIDSVVEVLRSDYLTQGPLIEKFEHTVAHYVGAHYAVAVCNATAALHIACLALGLEEGDILWTSPITFAASANVALLCGASVDFVDIDDDTYNMSVECLEQKLKQARAQNKLPKVVMPVHFSGQSCDMKRIYELSQEYGFKIIEDASHAIGARYENNPVGCCQYSDITVFSFHPVKIITTGEGGMAMTNSKELATKMSLLRTHGITRDPAFLINQNEGSWYYEQQFLGLNYRITDIQCALGISQLSRIDEFLVQRNKLAALYTTSLAHFPFKLPTLKNACFSSWHLYCIQVVNIDRKDFFEIMRAKNIGVNVHYIPVYWQPYYRKIGFTEGLCPVAESYYKQAITLPLHPDLTDHQFNYILDSLQQSTRLVHVA